MTTVDASEVAGRLTEKQRGRVMSFGQEPRQMGHQWGVPLNLTERTGLNHPIFGSHYRLTKLGTHVLQFLREERNAVRAHLQERLK